MLLILFFIIFKQLLWSGYIPVWQFPDEQAHFGQVQNIAEGNIIVSSSTSKEIYEMEKILGTDRDGFGNNKFTYHPQYNYEYSKTSQGLYEQQIKNFPVSYRKELVIKEATFYPPLYYDFLAFFYKLFGRSDIMIRLFAVRLANLILYALFVLCAYQTSKLLFSKNTIFQMALTILITCQPMISFIFAGVNSDNIYNLLSAWIIYFGIKLIIDKKFNWHTLISLLIIFLINLYTKPQAKLLGLVLIWPLMLTFFRMQKYKLIILLTFLLIVLISFGSVGMNWLTHSQILPEVAPIQDLKEVSVMNLLSYLKINLVQTYKQTLPWYWGIYRWLSLSYPIWVYRIINFSIFIAVVGWCKQIISSIYHRKLPENIDVWGFIFFASFAYYFGLVIYDYMFFTTHLFSLGLQGRYFFPTIICHMSIIIAGWHYLFRSKKMQNILIKTLAISTIFLQLFAVFWVLQSYYQLQPLTQFFLQASQYKPDFVKSPVLEVILILSVMANIGLIWKIIVEKNIHSNKF